MKIILDVLRLQEPEPAHAYLKESLGLPDYYGHNLDALYDCLTDPGPEVEIVLENQETLLENLGLGYWRLVRMLADAAEESRRILRAFHFLCQRSELRYPHADDRVGVYGRIQLDRTRLIALVLQGEQPLLYLGHSFRKWCAEVAA